MNKSPASRGADGVPQRDIELAGALARERLLDTHIAYALELVERARGEVSPFRTLAIYLRLHPLPQPDAEILTHRVMVALGQQEPEALESAPDVEDEEDLTADEWDGTKSLVKRIQHRLRGRVNTELREWVELHSGRTEVALLEIHVQNALRFVQLMKPVASHAQAVETYAGSVHVSKQWLEPLYYLTLARVSGSPIADTEGLLAASTRRQLPAPVQGSNLRLVEGAG